jgi:hypothetical protein
MILYLPIGKNCNEINEIRKYHFRQALVVHTCNPSYSGSRDQEDHSSKPARESTVFRARDSTCQLFTQSQKIRLVEWLKVKALSSSPSSTKKKKKRRKQIQF